jgi:hypothetical protein
MVTLSANTDAIRIEPHRSQRHCATIDMERWTRSQTEVMGHIIVLEQATMAVFEGYLGGPLYHRAVYAAQQLLALTDTMAWREGTHVARAMTHLFHTDAAFGLIQALHLSELIAAFYREVVQATNGQTPSTGMFT